MSIRKKILLLVSCPLLILSVLVGISVLYSVKRSMLEELQRTSENSMTFAVSAVTNRYDMLFRGKAQQALALKERMSGLVNTLAVLTARASTPLEFLQQYPVPPDVTLIAVDKSFLPVVRSGGELPGNPYLLYDIKGRPVGASMQRLALRGLPAVCLVQLPGPTERSFLGSSFFHAGSGLLIGLWIDISQLDKERSRVVAESMQDLQKSFSAISIGPSGFLFIMDGKGQVLVGQERLRNGSKVQVGEGQVQLAPALAEQIRYASSSVQQVFTADAGEFTGKVGQQAHILVHYVKSMDWYVVGLAYQEEALAPGKRLSLFLVSAILGAMLLLLPIAAWSATRLMTPLAQLSRYARDIPKQDFFTASPTTNELVNLADGSHGREVTELASSFQFMDATLRLRVKELVEASAARERLEGELNAAKEVQKGFLPLPLPPEVATGRFSVAASLVPARQVGGDLYDFFMLDNEHLCFLIGDVSDKGMPAALFMSMVMTLIRSRAKPGISPEVLIREVNEQLVKDNPRCMFVTLFIGVLNLCSGQMHYVNGGHNPPLLLDSGALPTWLDQRSGPIVGVIEDIAYQPYQITIAPGDLLFLYTDGVSEAMDKENRVYGKEALFQCLSRTAHSPVLVLNAVLADVGLHTNGYPASDDMTMLCLHYLGDAEKEPS